MRLSCNLYTETPPPYGGRGGSVLILFRMFHVNSPRSSSDTCSQVSLCLIAAGWPRRPRRLLPLLAAIIVQIVLRLDCCGILSGGGGDGESGLLYKLRRNFICGPFTLFDFDPLSHIEIRICFIAMCPSLIPPLNVTGN